MRDPLDFDMQLARTLVQARVLVLAAFVGIDDRKTERLRPERRRAGEVLGLAVDDETGQSRAMSQAVSW